MREYDVIVIGAGAAGLMCAGSVAPYGKSVLVLDHAEKAGKKILISGGGRCNFTNRFAGPADFVSANPHFCKSALARFSAADCIAWVEQHGIRYHEREHGQLFCDDSARQILEMLLAPCRDGGVEIRLNTAVHTVERSDDGYRLTTDKGVYHAAALVVATGGLSIPKMGATALGLKIAESFGLHVIAPVPGLVPFTFTGREKERLNALAGISLPVQVSCRGRSFREAMLFTHRGLSGPAMLQISSYWQPGDALAVDLLPDMDTTRYLDGKREQRPQAQLATVLAELLPRRLVQLLTEDGLGEIRLVQLSDGQRREVEGRLHNWLLKPNGTEGYRTAEVTVGGVDTDELSSKTMECKRMPGLYFIGEVVDVTGHLGGFNFQWAWSSGYAAAMAIVSS
ncbi:NAD(P)/FAD-dependent oxidoreductase [Mariprofundus erugo]|uniref:NAD(P)/FAD-dependent oxidoreductase n=1 Tax=Mariprofundus erugo TaxID=2528639 RepID=A0A5R9GQ69_9PROT|nr:NAD(P)/FAD-dependent oxidoreductase [Mariprofundus erugo]TLS67059.1 NAD(P)/FAD-dependent oxidoreductase [Mariprofundus erugo]TLS77243.1 NAD(P)/FAD-dependent oxidoreductase [Mariprofundus erugo]